MGSRKQIAAEKRKEATKDLAFARLRNCPTSPRKMRIVANLIRGVEVEKALHILKITPNEPAIKLRKLLLSAISNWQQKNPGVRVEEAQLFVNKIFVDQGGTIKRLRTAPQGRGYRMRKRSNHVTLFIDSKIKLNNNINNEENNGTKN